MRYLNSPELDSQFSLIEEDGDLEFVRARLRIENLPQGSSFYILTSNADVTTEKTLQTPLESVWCSYNKILQYRFSFKEIYSYNTIWVK